MAKTENPVPKMNDPVFLKGHGFVRYVVVSVNTEKKTADIKSATGVVNLTRDVPWSELSVLDESQNALRVVREATEES
jgi:hypothetical protein